MTDVMKSFWDERLKTTTSLVGTGHRAFNLAYNKALYAMQSDTLDMLLSTANISLAEKRVLDVGSGIGYYINYFQQRGAKNIIGIDIAPTSVSYLQKTYPQYQFQCTDIGSSSGITIDGKFDFISAISVLYHIVDDDRFASALNNICSYLAPGGFLVLTDMFRKTLQLTARHAKFRTTDSYSSVFAAYNLKIIDQLPMYYFMNRTYVPVIAPKILQLKSITQLLLKIDTVLRKKRYTFGSGLQMMLLRRTA